MITSGLVSITFREFEPQKIVGLVKKAGLDGIEWGGDIHVPHGNIQRAREVYQMTADAGLRVLAYGSYYHIGEKEEIPFESILDTAAELHTRVIRVWAGRRGSADADSIYWKHVVDESRRIADLVSAREMTVAYEFHGGTLTDTDETAVQLLQKVAHPNIKSYWQIPAGRNAESSLQSLLPWLLNVHVFYWEQERLMLDEGAQVWTRLLPVIQSTGQDHSLMLEFVKDNDPDIFMKDAETLSRWLSRLDPRQAD